MIYTVTLSPVTLSHRFTPTASLSTSSAKGALEFYSRPSPAWPVTAEIKRDGKVISVDALIRDAMLEDAQPAPL